MIFRYLLSVSVALALLGTLETYGQTAFGPQEVITSYDLTNTDGARDVQAVDLDADGDLDILAAIYWGGKIVLYENIGGGNYAAQKVLANFTQVIGVHATDMDGDGDLDVLAANSFGGKVKWFKNLGGFNFNGGTLITSDAYFGYEVNSADLDGDGDMDVLTGSQGTGTSWYENLGGGVLGPIQTLDLYDTRSISAADLDADGDLDILAGHVGFPRGVYWYENLGAGNFSAGLAINAEGGMARAADLNGDGSLDVVTAFGEGVKWQANLGGGNFGPIQVISAKFNNQDISIADGDLDGDLDIVSAHEGSLANGVFYHENIGGGNFAPEVKIVAVIDAAYSLANADIDNDGKLDLITASFFNDFFSVYRNLGDQFASQQFLGSGIKIRNMSLGDLDADGDFDVVGSGYFDGKIGWYENIGGNFGQLREISFAASNTEETICGDLDGDGYEDVLAVQNPGYLSWYRNQGDGNFDAPFQLYGGGLKIVITANLADLDNDGDLEILAVVGRDGFASDTAVWFENLGSGAFGPRQDILSTSYLGGKDHLISADLDGDGAQDVVVSAADSDKLAWFKNLGAGNFAAEQIIATSVDGAKEIVAADFDGDDDLDILSASSLDNTVAWYKNLGGGVFGSKLVISSNTVYATSIDVADFDRDGDLDITTMSVIDNKVYWHENLGGSFGGRKLVSDETGGVSRVLAEDLNGDGYAEILSASTFDEKLAWYSNLLAPACDASVPPQNPNSVVSSTEVVLSWDVVPASVGCQIEGGSISPPGPTGIRTFIAPELSSVNFPAAAFPEGTTWTWSVRCACEIEPTVFGTAYSSSNSFTIPDLRQGAFVEGLNVGPNPAADFVRIDLPDDALSISVFDATGKLVFRSRIDDSQAQNIAVSDWAAGFYLFNVEQADGQTVSGSFIKE